MARKKHITINNRELTPTVLAVKEDKKTVSLIGFLWISIIFIVFVASALYIKEITTFLKKYLNYLPFVDIDLDDDDIIPTAVPNNDENTNNNTTNQETENNAETEATEDEENSDVQSYILVDEQVLAIHNANGVQSNIIDFYKKIRNTNNS